MKQPLQKLETLYNKQFLRKLKKLYMKYGVMLTSCGCCDGVYPITRQRWEEEHGKFWTSWEKRIDKEIECLEDYLS